VEGMTREGSERKMNLTERKGKEREDDKGDKGEGRHDDEREGERRNEQGSGLGKRNGRWIV
jgi:hypothetical protein